MDVRFMPHEPELLEDRSVLQQAEVLNRPPLAHVLSLLAQHLEAFDLE